MHNKAPLWNEGSQVYQLDFGGRVTQESAKNFQIEYLGKQVNIQNYQNQREREITFTCLQQQSYGIGHLVSMFATSNLAQNGYPKTILESAGPEGFLNTPNMLKLILTEIFEEKQGV